jgi:hypothetical protein
MARCATAGIRGGLTAASCPTWRAKAPLGSRLVAFLLGVAVAGGGNSAGAGHPIQVQDKKLATRQSGRPQPFKKNLVAKDTCCAD